jgi:carboxylesterase type B
MHRAWVRFIEDGDPEWPPYDLERRRMTIFDDPSRLASDPLGAERDLFSRRRETSSVQS